MKLTSGQLRRVILDALHEADDRMCKNVAEAAYDDGYDSLVGEVVSEMVDVFVRRVKSDVSIIDNVGRYDDHIDPLDQRRADARHDVRVNASVDSEAQRLVDELMPVVRDAVKRLRDL